ncbi:c-type cytochrome [Thalassobius vesicularis]|uniref:C-type cytochrome n=1 Tax=Thalassobius vesicularis TaxID=1294297 RepID=A0A4V3UZ70_9RHOB|nr:c-type cytochrome [Thalassobius vesicularis]THD74982.1 c-type cytochrome [Thalassobius vesicularis]
MRGKILNIAIMLVLLTGAAAYLLTAPKRVDVATFAGLTGDAAHGAQVFNAAGCASCHTAPDAQRSDRPILSGGRTFPSDFGTFRAPNISPDLAEGIGAWSVIDLANAMMHGTSPEGQHYYPAFPYTTYTRAAPQDIADLFAYLKTLPPSATPSQPHDVGFPFNIRRALGGWKLLFFRDTWITPATPEAERGRYLVEALGHCGECHTPRNALGGLDYANWLTGAPNPSGKGKIPNITPAVLDWSEADLVEYFTSGFTPDYDSAGGEMAEVVQNLSKLPVEDRQAIAAYLKSLP